MSKLIALTNIKHIEGSTPINVAYGASVDALPGGVITALQAKGLIGAPLATKQMFTATEMANDGEQAELTAVTDLAEAKADEAALTSTDYVDYSAVTAALALPENNTALINAKTAAIDAAVAALVFAEQSVLDTAKATANALTPGDYVDFTGVTAALALPETTEALEVTKAAAITAAIAALVHV